MEFKEQVTKLSKIVSKTATDTYNTVADKSGKMIEDAKLKIAVSDKEEQISDIYKVMGKTVYDLYKNGDDVGKVFTKEAKKIDKIIVEIEEMNKKILYNKGMRKCDNCSEIISIESAFCENCGTKQKAVKIKKDKKDEKEEEKDVVKEKVCPQCGLICNAKSKYCGKCGFKF